MDAEVLGTLGLKLGERLEELLRRHAVLGVAGVIHDAVGELEETARVEAAAHGLGDGAGDLLEEIDVADVVEVDDRPQLAGEGEVRRGRIVAREHDVLAGGAHGLGDHELRVARAIAAAAVLAQDGDQRGVGVGLHGEVLAKAGVPREGLANGLHVAANARLVIQMEGRGVLLRQGLKRGLAGEGDLEVIPMVWETVKVSGGADPRRLALRCPSGQTGVFRRAHAAPIDSAPAGTVSHARGAATADSPAGLPRRPTRFAVPDARVRRGCPRRGSMPAGSPVRPLSRTSISGATLPQTCPRSSENHIR